MLQDKSRKSPLNFKMLEIVISVRLYLNLLMSFCLKKQFLIRFTKIQGIALRSLIITLHHNLFMRTRVFYFASGLIKNQSKKFSCYSTILN